MEYDNLTPDQLEQLANAAFSYNRPLNLGVSWMVLIDVGINAQ
jgi:hypothetical protein